MINTSVRDPFDVHVARVLLLVRAFSSGEAGRLDGLSKLARLDFLLRYPVYLERLLAARGAPLPFEFWPTRSERQAVESAMVRYRYGPFDARYYLVVGRLTGLGFCEQLPHHPRTSLRLTEVGEVASAALVGPQWQVVDGRCRALKRGLDLSGERLGELIAAELPLAESRPWTVLSAG